MGLRISFRIQAEVSLPLEGNGVAAMAVLKGKAGALAAGQPDSLQWLRLTSPGPQSAITAEPNEYDPTNARTERVPPSASAYGTSQLPVDMR